MSFSGSIRKLLFGISLDETTCAKRGFRIKSPENAQRLETIGETFVQGYHAALYANSLKLLYQQLEKINPKIRGFAYEGAGMGLALLDFVTPWKKNRLPVFMTQYGSGHIYMLHVGAGWAIARTPWQISKRLMNLDPLLRWLAFDGYGFHQGYFKWPKYIAEQAEPTELQGYQQHVFDQGLGRSLWFVGGADVPTVLNYLRKFPAKRQGDLWSGIGLACTYAAGADKQNLSLLKTESGKFYPCLAQGSVFAAKARLLAGLVTQETKIATEVLCQRSVQSAAKISDSTLEDFPETSAQPAWEIWRSRIQSVFAAEPE